MPLLKVNQLGKIYSTRFGGAKVEALRDINFAVDEGEYIAIMGESGSGKTTLLNILASLDKPSTGQVMLDEKNMQSIPDKALSAFRRENLGFVFQDFNLLDTFSLRDNIYLPLVLSGRPHREMEERIKPVAQSLSISDLLEKFPYEVSGGQKQRAAVARALITEPRIILADEPTGALDSHSAEALLDIFKSINREGQTVLMVTHSVKAASTANRLLFLRDGQIYHQLYREGRTDEELFAAISDVLTAMAKGGELQ